ncbi:hypothetical protein [Spirosoma agri]|uniref:Uncharacterized protein n=1 Tax=Spirosoma agri TaxID=1987381 RepID=A0A6M0IJU2_9BACT|nr:hypothetical protein [Spirosoma agri]NEU68464.1 hypothetical protein [Spirosoma agri]
METQTAAYLNSPSPVVLIVYQNDEYRYLAVFVNQTREQAEALFKEKYPVGASDKYEIKEYEDVESYSITEDGNLFVNGSYK